MPTPVEFVPERHVSLLVRSCTSALALLAVNLSGEKGSACVDEMEEERERLRSVSKATKELEQGELQDERRQQRLKRAMDTAQFRP